MKKIYFAIPQQEHVVSVTHLSSSIPRDNDSIMDMLAAVGPLAVSVHFDRSERDFDEYSPLPAVHNEPNHGVVLTGYGMHPTGKMYWVFKNSWGSDWGNNGYFFSFHTDDPSTIFHDISFINRDKNGIPMVTIDDSHLPDRNDFGEVDVFTRRDSRKSTVNLVANLGFRPFRSENYREDYLAFPRRDAMFHDYLFYGSSYNPLSIPVCGVTVQNQSGCGICWVFVVNQLLSSAITTKLYQTRRLSFYADLSSQYVLNFISMSECIIPALCTGAVCRDGGNYQTCFDLLNSSRMGAVWEQDCVFQCSLLPYCPLVCINSANELTSASPPLWKSYWYMILMGLVLLVLLVVLVVVPTGAA